LYVREKESVKKAMITEAFVAKRRAFKVQDDLPIQTVSANLSWPILHREDVGSGSAIRSSL